MENLPRKHLFASPQKKTVQKYWKNGNNQTLRLKYPYGKGQKFTVALAVFSCFVFRSVFVDRCFNVQTRLLGRPSVLTSLDSNNMEDEAATKLQARFANDGWPVAYQVMKEVEPNLDALIDAAHGRRSFESVPLPPASTLL